MSASVPPATERPVLISIGGLPATGKTTIARLVAARRRAAYVRVDTIEVAIAKAEGPHESNGWEHAPGYHVGCAVAADQLHGGLDVVAESVNALARTRDGWRDVAARHGAHLLEVEIVCTDLDEHRRRVEHRDIDIAGIDRPTWQDVVGRDYQPWSRRRLVLDTAVLDPAASAVAVQSAVMNLVSSSA